MRTFGAVALLLSLSSAAYAAGKDAAEAAVNDAVQAEDAAAKVGNRWVPTEASLKAAKAALASGSWDTAVSEAAKARALATRAIEQSQEQETAWRDAVIR